ncbi:MAG: hypothetical protein Q4G25_11775 [Paracoccus sp. (in: a-proteobacteria)]|nr:hypothetical protein [Paracoccus sp. (in: a-proteobacteria)]
MNVLIFGASGMIGQAVLHAALADPQVNKVLSLVRKPTGITNPRLTEISRDDFTTYDDLDLSSVDACLFCLGVLSSSVTPEAYRVITYDYAVAAARALLAANPDARFLYISGAGTDANSRTLWRRVKGETENALMAMPFRGAFMLRPGFIQPMDGVTSRTPSYRLLYKVIAPLLGPLRRIAPGAAITSADLARAMLLLGREGAGKQVLNTRQLNDIAAAGRVSG